jgi:hypothetical protein
VYPDIRQPTLNVSWGSAESQNSRRMRSFISYPMRPITSADLHIFGQNLPLALASNPPSARFGAKVMGGGEAGGRAPALASSGGFQWAGQDRRFCMADITHSTERNYLAASYWRSYRFHYGSPASNS